MASKSPRVAPPPLPEADPLLTPPVTTADYLTCIRALDQRVREHVRFISGVGSLAGTSAEAKAKALAVFYERLAVLEGHLSRARQNLELG